MADGDNIDIGNKKVGLDTNITLTVKTLVWIIGIAISFLSVLFSWFYFDNKSREDEMKKEMAISMKEFQNDMKSDVISLRQQIFDLARGQGEMKTDLKTIINKQVGVNDFPNNDNETRGSSNAPMSPGR